MAALLVGRERLLRGIYVREVHAPVMAALLVGRGPFWYYVCTQGACASDGGSFSSFSRS